MQLGFIGTGEITSAIVTGLSSSGGAAHSIWLSPRNAAIANGLAKRFQGISVAASNQEILDRVSTIVIAVRPSVARDVLAELHFRPNHHVISVVAGLSLQSLAELVTPAERVARAVPLPSAAKRLSPTAICPPDPVAAALFSAVGTVFPVEKETEFNAICATTATIASYFALNAAIASWLQQQGLPATQARDYTAQLFFGEASTAVEMPERSFPSLATAHTTPGGLNEQFLKHLTDHGVLTRVSEALDAVMQRISMKS